MGEDIESHLDAVYGASDDQDSLNSIYDGWAQDYERNLWASGNPYIAMIVGYAVRHIPDRQTRILDGGCGPGVLSAALHMIGYDNIAGLDPSEGMLAVAKSKGCYAELHNMLLAPDIDFADESFDGIIVSGVLTHGHAPPDALDGILRIAKPGAPVIFTMSGVGYDECGFKEKMQSLEDEGRWLFVEKTAPFRTFPFIERHAEVRHWVNVYRKPHNEKDAP